MCASVIQIKGKNTAMSLSPHCRQPITILLVEDNPADARLTEEALRDGKLDVNLYVVRNGTEAMDFLRQTNEYVKVPQPDLIFLDLNLPGKKGSEILADVKCNDRLKHIPVIILTSSEADADISNCYNLHANCYITKPTDLNRFANIIRIIEDFWFTIVKLPTDITCAK